MDRIKLLECVRSEIFSLTQNYYKWFEKKDLLFVYNEIFSNVDIGKLSAIEKSKMLYDFLIGVIRCSECGNTTKYISFSHGYLVTCSKECWNKRNSRLKSGQNNPMSSTMASKKSVESMKKKLSLIVKEKIKNNEWTPCVTNSWANSRIKIKLDSSEYEFRSTWEALFWLLNKNCLYEKVRVPYVYKYKKCSYIVDFIDEKNKILYEIKPKSKKVDKKNKIKFKYAKRWCKSRNYKFIIIDESYFCDNVDILESLDIVKLNDKLCKSVNNFKRIKDAN